MTRRSGAEINAETLARAHECVDRYFARILVELPHWNDGQCFKLTLEGAVAGYTEDDGDHNDPLVQLNVVREEQETV